MLVWSERIYRQRGVEPPNRWRLHWALTQAAILLESRGQKRNDRKRGQDLYDGDTSDTVSDAGAQRRVKRTKTQSFRASHESNKLPELTSTEHDHDPKIVFGAVNASNIPENIATDSEVIQGYLTVQPEEEAEPDIVERFRAAQQSGEYVEYVFSPNERSTTEPPETPVTTTVTTTSTGILLSASTKSDFTEHTSDPSEGANSDSRSSEETHSHLHNPEPRDWTLGEAMQYLIDYPPPEFHTKTLEVMQYMADISPHSSNRVTLGEAMQYFRDNWRAGTRTKATSDTQAYLDSNRPTLKRKRAGEQEAELEGVVEEEAEDDDEFEGFED